MNQGIYACKWCGVSGSAISHRFKERMYGDGTVHSYDECPSCHSLQLQSPLPDLTAFYPRNYHAYGKATRSSRLKRWLQIVRSRLAMTGFFRSGNPLASRLHMPWIFLNLGDVLPRDRAKALLDVGCGSGNDLLHLADAGYRNLTGIDPFIGEDLHYPNGVNVWKRSLAEHEGCYDTITSYHSLEHMPEPQAALQDMKRLLALGGRIIIRLPLGGGAVWREYGEHWVQLDPPRHLTIPTEKGFYALCARIGLAVEVYRHDSGPFQFWGSELAKQGRPFVNHSTGRSVDPVMEFGPARVREWQERSVRLNIEKNGDQALFVCRHA